jgi:hypothetical protein
VTSTGREYFVGLVFENWVFPQESEVVHHIVLGAAAFTRDLKVIGKLILR